MLEVRIVGRHRNPFLHIALWQSMGCLSLFYVEPGYTLYPITENRVLQVITTVKITHFKRIGLIVRNHVDNGNIRTLIEWELGVAA